VGWNEESHMVTADSTVWERLITAYPKAGKFKKKGLEYYPELLKLFASSRGT
jgi:hypothetical protein